MASDSKPYGLLRLHRECFNFVMLQHTPELDVHYRCNACDANLHPRETIDMDTYISLQKGKQVEHDARLQNDGAFLPYQVVTFTKKKEIDSPVVANEYIVDDNTNYRAVFFCDSCAKDVTMVLVPNNLQNLSFRRICEQCRRVS